MLKQRVITGLVLVSGLLGSLYLLSPAALTIFFAAIFAFAAWEWSNLAGLTNHTLRMVYVALIGGLLWFLMGKLHTPDLHDIAQKTSAMAICWWLLAFLLVRTYPDTRKLWDNWFLQLAMGVVVLVSAWFMLAVLLTMVHGKYLLLLLIGVVALADIGAYFSGKSFGKHKLAVRVSPGKTWEGVAGGVLANIILYILLAVKLDIPQGQWFWMGLLLLFPALVSVVGDLFESMLKRARGIKDSGNILPGHGGLLDRIDGLVASLPAFVLVLSASGLQL